jgi:hypothetical protein
LEKIKSRLRICRLWQLFKNRQITPENFQDFLWVGNFGLEFVDSGSFSRIAKLPLQISGIFCGLAISGNSKPNFFYKKRNRQQGIPKKC